MKQSTIATTVPTTARAIKPSTTKSTAEEVSSALLPSTATAPSPITVGLNMVGRQSHFRLLLAGGRPLEHGKVAMSREDLTPHFARVAPARVVLRSPIPCFKSKLCREHA